MSFNSVYTQIWRVLLHLAADPFPEVSDLAMKVLNSIAYKVGVASPLFSVLVRQQKVSGDLWGTLEPVELWGLEQHLHEAHMETDHN